MSTYNKHINTFDSGSTYNVYIFTEDCQVPNVAYLQDSDTVKMLKVKPQEITGEVGGIYYSDGTTTGADEAVDTTKTPIGVIVQAPTIDNGLKTIIAACYSIKSDGTNSTDNNSQIKWAVSGTEAATTDNSEIPNDDDGTKDISTYSGKAFTKVLVDKYGSDAQAAYACSLYSTDGTNAGDWYLPSASELKQKWSPYETVISNAYTKLKTLSKGYGIYTPLWSSSESDSGNAKYAYWGSNLEFTSVPKTGSYYVRPFCTIDPFENL